MSVAEVELVCEKFYSVYPFLCEHTVFSRAYNYIALPSPFVVMRSSHKRVFLIDCFGNPCHCEPMIVKN
jgi:hypothetical protein